MKSWMEISEEELVFTLPLYRKLEIDWLNMVKKTVPQVECGYEYNEYVTYMSEEFVKLVNFVTNAPAYPMYNEICPRVITLSM